MSRSHSYINSASQILKVYSGEEPFSSFIKKYFAGQPKFGSRDRKIVSHLCYCFFRLGKAADHLPIPERILLGIFLVDKGSNMVLEELRQEWNNKIELSLEEKIAELEFEFHTAQIFPFENEISNEVDFQSFCHSLLIQPDLFLRIRPNEENPVIKKLNEAEIKFEKKGNSLRLKTGTRVERFLEIDREVVIQDLNSQRVLEPLLKEINSERKREVWDCCAASGGKSILAIDNLPLINLTVSDIRSSILVNLRKRFDRAGIQDYHWFVTDVGAKSFSHHKKFDIIICDAPCTGSGTWARTPEQLMYFMEDRINSYAALQKTISLNALKCLKPGGLFVYITCSVFKKENEEAVQFIEDSTSMKILSQQYFPGYDKRADTLFTAVFKAV